MDGISLSVKSKSTLIKKKKLNLAINIIIAFMGITSLALKFFVIDGLLAFRAFTVNGNLFTTIVTIVAIYINLLELKSGKENKNVHQYFFSLASAVTEAVIFIIVMIGYLPVFPDNPAIWPYHMFCLHVGIPVLAVLRFIFFEKPIGIVKPFRLLTGAIPIGVYGLGVTIAIKVGLLPIELVPYSFLDFKNNFIWYFLFALFVIPSFGYLWSWLFYRLNLRAAILWFNETDVRNLQRERIKSASSFDVVNSGILLIFCMCGLLLLSFSLLNTSRTSTKIQQYDLSWSSFFMLDDYHHAIIEGDWSIRDGVLYKGDVAVGDGTAENANSDVLPDEIVIYEASFFVKASDLSPEVAAEYDPDDYVSVASSSGKKGPVAKPGQVLEEHIVEGVEQSEESEFFEEVTYEEEIDNPIYESKYRILFEEEKKNRVKYFRYSLAFGSDMMDEGVGIVSIYIPVSDITAEAKSAELNADISMIVVVSMIFAFLYMLVISWIKGLEKSVDYLRELADDRIPDEPLKLGGGKRLKGLELRVNKVRKRKISRMNPENNDGDSGQETTEIDTDETAGANGSIKTK